MTENEMVERLEKACQAEDLFPGVLGNPVTFAGRWGLPLSRGYLKQLDAKRTKRSNRHGKNGNVGSRSRRKSRSAAARR